MKRKRTASDLAHARAEKLLHAALAKQKLADGKREVEAAEMKVRRVQANPARFARRVIHPIVTLAEVRHGVHREGISEADYQQELEYAKAIDAREMNQRPPTKSELQAQLPKDPLK